MRRRIPKDHDLSELPQAKQRPPAKPLDDYVREKPEHNDTIVAAYRSGGYTLRDIGEFFSLHHSRYAGGHAAWSIGECRCKPIAHVGRG